MTKKEKRVKKNNKLVTLLERIEKMCPGFAFERDNYNQVVIYTNIYKDEDGYYTEGNPGEDC